MVESLCYRLDGDYPDAAPIGFRQQLQAEPVVLENEVYGEHHRVEIELVQCCQQVSRIVTGDAKKAHDPLLAGLHEGLQGTPWPKAC